MYSINLGDIKNEFLLRTSNMLRQHIFSGLESIYDYSVEENKKYEIIAKCDKKNPPALSDTFKNNLASVPEWNSDMIQKETLRIKTMCSNGDIFDKLIKATIKSNITWLLSNKANTIEQKHKIEITDFIHKVYIYSAKRLYNNPLLFKKEVTINEKTFNVSNQLSYIDEGIKDAIWFCSPIDDILNEYLNDKYTMPQVIPQSNVLPSNVPQSNVAQSNIVQPNNIPKTIENNFQNITLKDEKVKSVPLTTVIQNVSKQVSEKKSDVIAQQDALSKRISQLAKVSEKTQLGVKSFHSKVNQKMSSIREDSRMPSITEQDNNAISVPLPPTTPNMKGGAGPENESENDHEDSDSDEQYSEYSNSIVYKKNN